jgi:hypothetical protein
VNPLAVARRSRYKTDMGQTPLEFAMNHDPMSDGIAADSCDRASVVPGFAPGLATEPLGVAWAPVPGARAAEHPARRPAPPSANAGPADLAATPAEPRRPMAQAPEAIPCALGRNIADDGGSHGARAIREPGARDVCERPRRAVRLPKRRRTHRQEQIRLRHAGRQMRIATRPACPTGPIRGEARP